MLVEKAEGSWIHESGTGSKFLDFTCGIGVTNLGHAHPAVNKAAIDQMSRGVHLQMNCVTSKSTIELASLLAARLPAPLSQVHFANSGAESVENAIKLARHATKKTNVITFKGSFHGRTIATGAMTNSKTVYRAGFQPSMSGVFVAPFPYCLRCPANHNQQYPSSGCNNSLTQSCCSYPLTELRALLKMQTSPDETAAILLEPVLGEGGYVVPPKQFFKDLRQLADEIGALLIVDEVQSGIGRTGSLFAFSQFDIVPDIVVIAKGIANGLPLSAIASKPHIFEKAKPGSIGGTYAGNAVSAAAACEVLKVIDRDNILQNVRERGTQLSTGLLALKQKYGVLSEVRGLGLMIGAEFEDKAGAGAAGRVAKAAKQHGLLLLTAGAYETIRFIPPLTVSRDEVSIALDALDKAFADVFGKRA